MDTVRNIRRSDLRMEEIIDRDVLDRVQERFCSVANIYSMIMDDKGRMLTEMTGDEADVRLLYEKLGQDAFFRVYDRVAGDSLEEQVVERTAYENVRLAAFQVRVRTDFVLNWIVCAVFEVDADSEEPVLTEVSRYTQELRFYDALDLMRLIANRMLSAKSALADVEAERLKIAADNENMSGLLKRAEAMTAIVQLLGSDDDIQIVFEKLLGIVGEYLHISSAQIFAMHTGGQSMDLLAEWCLQGVHSMYEKTKNMKRSPLLKGERTNVISSNTLCSAKEKRLMEKAHIRAMVTFPIVVDGRIGMYAVFRECQHEHQWSLEEIRFMNDAVQVVQSILVRRIRENSSVSPHT